jgi:hypothetical protein
MSEQQRPGLGEHSDYDDDVRDALAPLAGPESPPDREFLRGLRERSAEEFARSTVPTPALVRTDASRENPTRRKTLRGKRAITVAAACAAALAVWFVGGWLPAAQGVTLGDALRKSAAAKSLKLELRRDGQQSEVLVAGDRARWNETPERYTVVRGSQLWRVDEETNTAVREKAPADFDLLSILEASGGFQLARSNTSGDAASSSTTSSHSVTAACGSSRTSTLSPNNCKASSRGPFRYGPPPSPSCGSSLATSPSTRTSSSSPSRSPKTAASAKSPTCRASSPCSRRSPNGGPR